jgi:GntR family transcriptional regulator, N-acetylglucosamine utilization regulator
VARFRLELGPVPLHHQVYLDLKSALDAGEWQPGDRLPPERELAARYGCSLITVRRALDELSRERRLTRARGRGTHVSAPPIDRNLQGSLSFAEEMLRLGKDPGTRLISARPESATETVAAALRIEPGSPTVYLERLRLAAGVPMLLEMVHLPAERFPGLLQADFEHASLYDLLATKYRTPVARARETLEPVLVPTREARLLEVRPRSLALLVEGLAFSIDGVPIEYGRTYVRGDLSRYFVERVVVRAAHSTGRGGEPDLVAAGITLGRSTDRAGRP